MKTHSIIQNRKMVAFTIALTLIMVMGMTGFAASAAGALAIKLDGAAVATDVAPYIDANDRTMVPVRFISEAFGAEVEWLDSIRTVTVTKDDTFIQLVIDSRIITTNGVDAMMDTAAVLTDGRTFVPVRYIAEALGLGVAWDGDTNTVLLTTGSGTGGGGTGGGGTQPGGTGRAPANGAEARGLLLLWFDSHPFQLGAAIEPEYDEYTYNGNDFYRFNLSIIRLGGAEILVQKDTGKIYHLTSPGDSVGFVLADEWYTKDHDFFNDEVKLTIAEARGIAQAWLDAHPDMVTPYEPTTIRQDFYLIEYAIEGYNDEAYYLFDLEGYYWLDILVNAKTGALLGLHTEESDDPDPPTSVEPLDDYYNRFYG